MSPRWNSFSPETVVVTYVALSLSSVLCRVHRLCDVSAWDKSRADANAKYIVLVASTTPASAADEGSELTFAVPNDCQARFVLQAVGRL